MDRNVYLISSDELIDKIDQDHSNSKFKKAAESLLEAINDWPTSLSEPNELLLELSVEIGIPLTFERIKKYSEKLDAKKSAWKMEATSSLLEIFDFDKTKTLDNIITDISEFYKSN